MIFDCLTSEFWADEKYAVELISDAVEKQNVLVLLFNFKQEEVTVNDVKSEIEVCSNMRYAQRHDPSAQNKKQAKQEENKEATERQTPRPAKSSKNVAKSLKGKDKKSTEELDIAAIEAEAERLRKKQEAEQAALEAAEAKKDRIRPKEMSADEKKAWREYAQAMSDFHGDLVMKTIPDEKPAEDADPEQQQDDQQNEEPKAVEEPKKEIGQRNLMEINVEYNYTFLCEHLCASVVPEPIWPDPDKEPLPPPVISSILKKPPNRAERNKITKFSIFTPTLKDGEKWEPTEEEPMPPMSDAQTRWVLGPKESKKLYLKFFSTQIGQFSENLQFEIIGSYKAFTLPIQGMCEFPQIN